MRILYKRLLNFTLYNFSWSSYPFLRMEHFSFYSHHCRETRYVTAVHNNKSLFFVSLRNLSTLKFAMTYLFRRHFKFFYIQVVLYGFNFKFKRRRKKYSFRVNMHEEHWVFYRIPKTIIYKMYKRRFCLFGLRETILPFLHILFKVKETDAYTGKGIKLRSGGFKLKPGKVRLR